jgi:hypothetical protein
MENEPHPESPATVVVKPAKNVAYWPGALLLSSIGLPVPRTDALSHQASSLARRASWPPALTVILRGQSFQSAWPSLPARPIDSPAHGQVQ